MISSIDIAKKYTPEMALFVLVCRRAFKKAPVGEVKQFLSEYTIDWEIFYEIITGHQLRPLVYKTLSEFSVEVDQRFFSKLKQDTLRIASGNLLKLDEMVKLCEALATAGVSAIPYKGVLLSQQMYGDFVTRETGDIDIMIRVQDFGKAYDVLVSSDFRTANFFDLQLTDSFVKTESELMFIKGMAGGYLKVELHWEVTHTMMHVPLDVEQLFSNARHTTLLGRKIGAMDERDLLIILLTHHGVNDVWRTFRHVVDVAALLETNPEHFNSNTFDQLLGRFGLRRTTAIGLQLCYDLLGVGATSSIGSTRPYKTVLDKLLSRAGADRYKLSKENVRLQFMLRDSLADKLRLALSYIKVAYRPNIRDVQTLRLPRPLHFLYYFLKPFLFLARRK